MPFINTLEGNPDGGWNNFFSSNVFIGFYFVFIGVAFISIVVWVFNWICWYHQCCCFDFLHNPTNKRFAWWLCVVFFWAFSPVASPPLSPLIDSDLLCKELGVVLVECTMIANLDNSNLILLDGKDTLI